MNFDQALRYYGSSRAIAKVLDVTDARVSQLKASGGFSYPLQCVIEKESGGSLVARKEDIPSESQSAA